MDSDGIDAGCLDWRAVSEVSEALCGATSFADIIDVVRPAARRLSGADGVTIVMRDGAQCHYIDEDAISPLWKGRRFPMEACISGWCMQHEETAVIPDIYADPRIPADAYRATFVQSLVMIPVGAKRPVAAIGAYWARAHTPDQRIVSHLETLARLAATALVSVQRLEAAQQSERRLTDLLEALPAAVYTTDAEGRVTYCNRAAAELAGFERRGAEWRAHWKLFAPDGAPLGEDESPMAAALHENIAISGEIQVERPGGPRVPVIAVPTPIRNSTGGVAGGVNVLVDISERKEAEARQRVLLDELNHRVKNNLQMLLAMIQSAQRGSANDEAKAILSDAAQRVGAMAAVQKVLYDDALSSSYRASDFLDAIAGVAGRAFGADADLVVESADGQLASTSAMPLALIANELITNAVKHGRHCEPRRQIRLGLLIEGGQARFYVENDGPGFEIPRPANRASGLGLVIGLARQLGGEFSVEERRGTCCSVRFPVAALQPC